MPPRLDTLRVAFVGGVDHGKSTLLGRILLDTGAMTRDRLVARIEDGGLAFLLDGLAEERDGLYTLDTTQAVVDTPERQFLLIDVPGHVELLSNTVTGASRADLGVVVVDPAVRAVAQTRRHLRILEFLGVTTIVCAVTKMDAVDYAEDACRAAGAELGELAAECGLRLAAVVPVSATEGRNILAPAPDALPWYGGQPLIGTLHRLGTRRLRSGPLRFVVQAVVGPAGARRAAGRVEAGVLRAGTVLTDGCGSQWTVRAIERYGDAPLDEAGPGDSVGLGLDGPEPTPGTILAPPGRLPARGRIWRTRILTTSLRPVPAGCRCTVRYSVTSAAGRVDSVLRRWDSADMTETASAGPARFTEFAELRLRLDAPAAADPRSGHPLGRFMLCDEIGRAMAVGVVDDVVEEDAR